MTSPLYRLGKEPPNKGQTFPVEVLTRSEALKLLRVCSPRARTGVRDAALLVAMWRGGLRVGEAVALFPRDVDPAAGVLNLRRGKGAKQRIVGIDPDAMAVIDRWLELRARLGFNGRKPLFLTLDRGRSWGRPMRTSLVNQMVHNRAQAAGLEKRVHPHALRHTHASELSLEGVPVDVIRRQLGHRSLATTQRYLDHVAPLEIVRTMQARSWNGDHPDTSG